MLEWVSDSSCFVASNSPHLPSLQTIVAIAELIRSRRSRTPNTAISSLLKRAGRGGQLIPHVWSRVALAYHMLLLLCVATAAQPSHNDNLEHLQQGEPYGLKICSKSCWTTCYNIWALKAVPVSCILVPGSAVVMHTHRDAERRNRFVRGNGWFQIERIIEVEMRSWELDEFSIQVFTCRMSGYSCRPVRSTGQRIASG